MKQAWVIICLGGLVFIFGCDNASKKAEQIVITSKFVKEVAATNAISECAPLVGQVVLMYGKTTYTRIVPAGCLIDLDGTTTCTFRWAHKKEIEALKNGDFVRVKGRIDSITALGVHLSYCIFAGKVETY